MFQTVFYGQQNHKWREEVSYFLTMCVATTYTLFRSLATPKIPSGILIAELLKLAAAQYHPKPSLAVQDFLFNSRKRQAGEFVTTYLAQLKGRQLFTNSNIDSDDNHSSRPIVRSSVGHRSVSPSFVVHPRTICITIPSGSLDRDCYGPLVCVEFLSYNWRDCRSIVILGTHSMTCCGTRLFAELKTKEHRAYC